VNNAHFTAHRNGHGQEIESQRREKTQRRDRYDIYLDTSMLKERRSEMEMRGRRDHRQDGFDITVASEVMAIFTLATSLADLQRRSLPLTSSPLRIISYSSPSSPL